jgi:hypothetical protein
MRHIQVNKSHKYQRPKNRVGELPDDEIDMKGHERRGVVSFQCSDPLWKKFDRVVEKTYGKYKKSKILEEMIRRFVDKEEKKSL